VRDPALILVVDDNDANVDILETRLTARGYRVITARDGEEALDRARADMPDLILLDVMMPKLDGLEVARRLRSDRSLTYMPIIHVTAKAETRDIVAGLDAGGDEYLTKPIDQAALSARVRSLLRFKALHDQARAQADELAQQRAALTELNQSLSEKVAAQVAVIERMAELRRFLPRELAERVVASDDASLLAHHRREVCVLFCDLRGFTAFSEISEPEEVWNVLSGYHKAVGPLIETHGGTLERFLGDGLMVIFNDPLPCPEPAHQAIRLAIDMRSAVTALCESWAKHGHDLGFGVGIAYGFATLGRIGFEGRSDYTAIGTVVNQAARLCGEAKAGEVLITQRVKTAVGELVETEPLGALALKGLRQPLATFRVVKA